MARINAQTGRLFTDPYLDLTQAVEDALLTQPGERRHRPRYGSYLLSFDRSVDAVIPSVLDVLRLVDGVEDIAVSVDAGAITVTINNASGLPRTTVRVTEPLEWRGKQLEWMGEELRW